MQDPQTKPSRRGFFLAAGVAGASAASVGTLARLSAPQPVESLAVATPPPERGGGYSLSEHVKRYYKTTRI